MHRDIVWSRLTTDQNPNDMAHSETGSNAAYLDRRRFMGKETASATAGHAEPVSASVQVPVHFLNDPRIPLDMVLVTAVFGTL